MSECAFFNLIKFASVLVNPSKIITKLPVKSPYKVEIFIAGSRPDSRGMMTRISAKDLQDVADTYNPQTFRAPAIVGHETGNYDDSSVANSELCHGFPSRVKREGSKLIAYFEKLSPWLAEKLRKGALHSVSPSFYLPNSPTNPHPGKLALRHIAFLGKTPPACKGMAAPPEPPQDWKEYFQPYKFASKKEKGVVEFMGLDINSPANPWNNLCDILQGFREWLIESEDAETADRIIPADDIAELRESALAHQQFWQQVQDLQARVEALESDDDSDDDGDDLDAYDGGTDWAEKSKDKPEEKRKGYVKAAKKKKMKVSDIAEETGIDKNDVEDYMTGAKSPPPDHEKKMDDCLMDYDDGDEKRPASNMSEQWRRRTATLSAREEKLAQKERDLERQEVASFVEGLVREGRLESGRKDSTIKLILAASNTERVEFSEGIRKTPRQYLMDEYASRDAWNYKELVVKPRENDYSGRSEAINFNAPSGYELDPQATAMYNRVMSYCEVHKLNPNDAEDWDRACAAVQKRGRA